MKNTVNKINNFFLRKYKNEDLTRFEDILASGNLQALRYYTKGGIILLMYIMAIRYFLNGFSLLNTIPFLVAMCIFLVLDVCAKKLLKDGELLSLHSKFASHIYCVTFVFLATFYDVIIQRNDISVLLCIALLISGAIFDNYPIDTLLFLSICFFIVLVCEGIFAPSSFIFWQDVFNCSIVFVAGFYISTTKLNKKIYILIQEEKEQKKKIKEAKSQVILNQLKPHFLYNSLSTIRILYRKDPEKADMAMEDFTNFLRSNIDNSLSTNYIIFSDELKNVKYYLNLEKLRFGNKLNIEYDIKEECFYLPVLTLQPIVENAVKYGLGNKIGGGTIKISTFSDEDNIILEIKDTGTGFKYNKEDLAKDKKRSHIGIASVTNRIKMMVSGTVKIDSKIGVGTTVTITIPKEVDEAIIHEYISVR